MQNPFKHLIHSQNFATLICNMHHSKEYKNININININIKFVLITFVTLSAPICEHIKFRH
jgi:hypothetical protein